jgi:hypothetical protein
MGPLREIPASRLPTIRLEEIRPITEQVSLAYPLTSSLLTLLNGAGLYSIHRALQAVSIAAYFGDIPEMAIEYRVADLLVCLLFLLLCIIENTPPCH